MYEQPLDLLTRAGEIAEFLDVPLSAAVERLERGFHANHALVAEDFRLMSPRNDDELLEWYMITEAYIWELSAYHLDEGFNYIGMCRGIAEKLAVEQKWDVLVLGDGIGDLTMTLHDSGLKPFYHDLHGSKTAEFARYRHYERYTKQGIQAPDALYTDRWHCGIGEEQWDAVVALDFMEHLPNVEEWARACARGIRPGGYLAAQNAFNIGSGDQGSIPMHLTSNDRYEHDWKPLMESLGFTQCGDIWWKKS